MGSNFWSRIHAGKNYHEPRRPGRPRPGSEKGALGDKNHVILSEVGSFALRMIQRSRRTPCNLTSASARQGVLPMLPLSKCLSTSIFALRGKGSFDSVRTSLRVVLSALRMTWLE